MPSASSSSSSARRAVDIFVVPVLRRNWLWPARSGAAEVSSSVVDFGRDSLREGEARPQAGDALGKRLMFLFLSCKRKIPKKSLGRAPR